MANKIADELDDLQKNQTDAVDASNKAYDDAIAANNQLKTDTENKLNTMKDMQTKVQNEQTEFAIDKIEQQREWAEKDYQKEQRGAWRDYQKQVDPYGVNAEQKASMGLSNSGYSESSKVAMYTAYQNRVATARESFQRATTEFTNQITQARLQNSAALAEIALATLEKSLEYSVTFAQQNNQLLLEKAQQKRAIDSDYFSRYLDLKSAERAERSIALDEAKFAYQKAQDAKSSGGFGIFSGNKKSGSSGGGGGKGSMKSTGAGKDKLKQGLKKTGAGKVKTVDEKPKVDMKSVLNLGHGPISAQKLNSLVKEGKAVETVKNGKIAFKPRFNW
jgi:hypothetical protein